MSKPIQYKPKEVEELEKLEQRAKALCSMFDEDELDEIRRELENDD